MKTFIVATTTIASFLLQLFLCPSVHAGTSDTQVLAPDSDPVLINFVDAVYPPEEMQAGRQGVVLLELLITEQGRVDSVSIVEGPSPALNEAAAEAARHFTFEPATAEGAPVPVFVQFAYEFSLEDAVRDVEAVINLEGVLKERGTRDPIRDAMVVVEPVNPLELPVPLDTYLARIGDFTGQFLEEGRLVTFTDEEGRFSFQSLPPGRIRVTAPNSGYLPVEVAEDLAREEKLETTLWLTRTNYDAYEIVVYGEEEETEVTRQSLSVQEIERLAGFGGDVIKSVQALPGVARPSLANSGAVIVRGSGNDDTRFYLDGIDIPLLFHFGGLKSTYNSLSLESVDLYPGGFGTRYGGAIGGIVELKGKPARLDRWKRVVDVSLLDSSIHAEGPLNKDWSLMFTARRSFVGELASAVFESNDVLNLAVAPYYWDGILRVDRRLDRGGRFFATAFVTGDRTEIVFPEEKEGSAEVNAATNSIETDLVFSRFIVGWDDRWGSKLSNSLRLAAGHNREQGHIFGEFDFDNKGPYYQLRNQTSVEWNPMLTTHVGVDLALSPFDYKVQVAGQPTTDQKKDFSDLGYYAFLDYRPMERWLLSPGVRYDYYDHLADGAMSYRLSSRFRLNDSHTLTGSVGTYNQDPQPAGQATDPVFGNPDLPPTEALHTTLGDEWRINDRTSLKIEGYFNQQSKIPVVTDSLDLNFAADADGRMYGIEFMLRREAGDRFFGWLSYSLSKAERRFQRRPEESLGGFDDIGTDPDATWDSGQWVPHTFDQTHHFEAVGSYNWGNNISTGLRVQYVTGNPQTPYLNYTDGQLQYDADTGEYVAVGGTYLSQRFDPFFRVDFRIDRKFIRRNSIWSVYADLQTVNYPIYNAPEGYTYNYDYTERESYGWIPTPSLGVRVEF